MLSFLKRFIPLLFFAFSAKAQIVINEVSQGPSGAKEYVEFVVTGTPSCTVPCVDLRGYIIDDNNGLFATGSGTGIASGCMRFANVSFWSCIPAGTIIVIYNNGDPNASLPAVDTSMTDGNCKLVIPASSCGLIEKNISSPSTGSSAYPSAFTSCGSWSTVGLANSGGDSFQIRNAAGTLVFAVSFNNNTTSNIIYLANGLVGWVCNNLNSTDTNPFNQSNWASASVTGNETPGAPNNAANAAWINSMNFSCGTVAPPSLTSSVSVTNANCLCTGSATVSASGGVAPYTYSWSLAASSSNTIGNLCAGNYSVTVSSANGCTTTASATVNSVSTLSVSATATNVSCNGGNDGQAQATAAGGTMPYSYTWSPSGGNAATATNLSAGIYTVTAGDAGGCTASQTVQVTEPVAISATVNTQNINCNGASTGAATVNVSGGTNPYSYTFSPSGGNSNTASNLAAGNYSIEISDANNCTFQTTFTLTQSPPISVSSTTISTTCGLANGSATIAPSGGNAPYTYSWNPTVSSNSSATNLAAGNYTITVSDGYSCAITATLNIAPSLSLTATTTQTNVSCFGGNNAQASVSVSNGTSPFSYTWSPTGGNLDTAKNLSAGNYSVTVTDANSCIVTASVSITEPPALSATASSTAASCGNANGSASVTVSGGTPAYTYTWSPSGGNGNTASNLSQGIYTVNISDNNLCALSQTVSVGNNPGPNLSVIADSVLCNGASTGSATVTAGGGTAPFTYSWSPTGGNNNTATNLNAGIYTVNVSDASGCAASATVAVFEPSAISAIVNITGTSCGKNNGFAAVNPSGGIGPYTYTWSPGNAHTASINNLAGGNYSVTISDKHNCTYSASANVAPSNSITLSVSSTSSVSCKGGNNGSISTSIANATTPVNYTWSPAGGNNSSAVNLAAQTYSLLAIDANGCRDSLTQVISQPGTSVSVTANSTTICTGNSATLTAIASGGNSSAYTYTWSTGAHTNTTSINPTANATYTVQASDGNNCLSNLQTVSVTVAPDVTVTVSPTATTICKGDKITLTATTSNNSIVNWMPGNIHINTITVQPSTAQTYTATATGNCSNASAVSTVNIFSNPVLSASINPPSGCAPLCVTFSASTTSVPTNNIVSYDWIFGDGHNQSGSIVKNCYSDSGNYAVSLVGYTSNGCRDSLSANNIVHVFAQPVADFSASTFTTTIEENHISFYDQSTGNIVSWNWMLDSATTSGIQNPSHDYTTEGTYSVSLIVINDKGCRDTVIKEIVIKPDYTFYAPNAFTPNADKNNESFLPKGIGWDTKSYDLWIYDRWGTLLYHTSDITQGWNGEKHEKPVQQDIYVWKVSVMDSFHNFHYYNGEVSLIR